MLKNLFKRIICQEKNFTNEELETIKHFIEEEIVLKDEEIFTLNSKYRVGILKIDKKSAVVVDLDNEHKNIKVDIEELRGVYNNDLVLVKRVFNPRARFKGKIIKVLESTATPLLTYTLNGSLFSVKEQILLQDVRKNCEEDGEVLIVNSKSFEAIERVGNINEAKVDEYISLYLYDELYRKEGFSEIEASMSDEQRVDLTSLPFTTIDPASAKDHDDAIYYDCENNIVYVAIADVSYFVKEDSLLDEEAFKRSTSIYLPNKVLPMLPASLSEDMCSLKEGLNRYAYVFKIYLNASYEVQKSELFEALIKSHRKFSYGRIDRVISGYLDKYTDVEKEIFDYLIPLYEVTKQIRAKRLEKGYDFISKEYRQKLNSNLELEAVVTEESTPSHQLIEECMLLANVEASKRLSNFGIFRIHEEPSFQAMSKLVDEVNLLGIKAEVKNDVHSTILEIQKKAKTTAMEEEINDLIIKSQSQAKYTSKNFGHFGLGFKSYSHFTSPIRRYSDLVLHRILKSKKVPEQIDAICQHISETERKVDQLVWDFEDRKYARWAKDNIGKEYKARVVDVERGIAKFYKDMAGLRVHLDNYKGEKLFSKIKVIIKSSDAISKNIVASVKN